MDFMGKDERLPIFSDCFIKEAHYTVNQMPFTSSAEATAGSTVYPTNAARGGVDQVFEEEDVLDAYPPTSQTCSFGFGSPSLILGLSPVIGGASPDGFAWEDLAVPASSSHASPGALLHSKFRTPFPGARNESFRFGTNDFNEYANLAPLILPHDIKLKPAPLDCIQRESERGPIERNPYFSETEVAVPEPTASAFDAPPQPAPDVVYPDPGSVGGLSYARSARVQTPTLLTHSNNIIQKNQHHACGYGDVVHVEDDDDVETLMLSPALSLGFPTPPGPKPAPRPPARAPAGGPPRSCSNGVGEISHSAFSSSRRETETNTFYISAEPQQRMKLSRGNSAPQIAAEAPRFAAPPLKRSGSTDSCRKRAWAPLATISALTISNTAHSLTMRRQPTPFTGYATWKVTGFCNLGAIITGNDEAVVPLTKPLYDESSGNFIVATEQSVYPYKCDRARPVLFMSQRDNSKEWPGQKESSAREAEMEDADGVLPACKRKSYDEFGFSTAAVCEAAGVTRELAWVSTGRTFMTLGELGVSMRIAEGSGVKPLELLPKQQQPGSHPLRCAASNSTATLAALGGSAGVLYIAGVTQDGLGLTKAVEYHVNRSIGSVAWAPNSTDVVCFTTDQGSYGRVDRREANRVVNTMDLELDEPGMGLYAQAHLDERMVLLGMGCGSGTGKARAALVDTRFPGVVQMWSEPSMGAIGDISFSPDQSRCLLTGLDNYTVWKAEEIRRGAAEAFGGSPAREYDQRTSKRSNAVRPVSPSKHYNCYGLITSENRLMITETTGLLKVFQIY